MRSSVRLLPPEETATEAPGPGGERDCCSAIARSFRGDFALTSRFCAFRKQLQNLFQPALSVSTEFAGRRHGCLEQVGAIATSPASAGNNAGSASIAAPSSKARIVH